MAQRAVARASQLRSEKRKRRRGAGARVRPDMKIVFFDEWETPTERLKGAAGILRALAGLAEKGRRAA